MNHSFADDGQSGDERAPFWAPTLRQVRTATGERDVGKDPVALVRALWDADRAGDLDGVLATMHPNVTWSPLSRVRTLYSGHDGIRRLHEEVSRTRGIRTVAIDDFTLTDTGNVICRGRATLRDGETTKSVQHFESSYIIRDGLIVSVETRHTDGD